MTGGVGYNAVDNPGFELGDWEPEGWTLPDRKVYSYDYAWDDEHTHFGEYALRIGRYFHSEAWPYLPVGPVQRFSVNPEKIYYLSFWYKTQPGFFPYTVIVRIKGYKGKWGYEGNQYWWMDNPEEWTQAEMLIRDLHVMEGIDNVSLRFNLERCPGWVWFDDLIWREATAEDIKQVDMQQDRDTHFSHSGGCTVVGFKSHRCVACPEAQWGLVDHQTQW